MREEKTLKEIEHNCNICKRDIPSTRVGIYIYNFCLEQFPRQISVCIDCTGILERKLLSNPMFKVFFKTMGVSL